jgi:(p)ppGpp synthase/HD superfamily hydrolase
MIYAELTKKALRIAYDAHEEQIDKAGLPYIFHPFHLAEQMNDEVSICVALLHDVVEDTAITFDDLTAQGIPNEVIDTLRLLTRDDKTSYMDYIQKIKKSGNPAAVAVKLADLKHNSDVSRLKQVDEKTSKRMEKYCTAIKMLE